MEGRSLRGELCVAIRAAAGGDPRCVVRDLHHLPLGVDLDPGRHGLVHRAVEPVTCPLRRRRGESPAYRGPAMKRTMSLHFSDSIMLFAPSPTSTLVPAFFALI